MPGIDYLGPDYSGTSLEYKSKQDDTYYNSGLAGIGLSIGIDVGSGYLMKRAKTKALALSKLRNETLGVSTVGLRETLKFKESLSFARSLRNTARMYTWLGTAQLGYSMGKGLFSLGRSFLTSKTNAEMARYNGRNPEENFFDSRMAATQRARALQVIHNSRISASPALGNEASFMHF